jgi:hypothetical protein
MNSDNFSKIVNTLIDNLPIEYKDSKHPIELDLVLDGGVFNGSYLVGALLLLKEMEKQNYVKVKRISGCSIGSFTGLLYFIDSLDISVDIHHIFTDHFKKTYNFEIYKNIKKYLHGRLPENLCNVINNKLYIKYNNVEKGHQKIKCKFKSIDDILYTYNLPNIVDMIIFLILILIIILIIFFFKNKRK